MSVYQPSKKYRGNDFDNCAKTFGSFTTENVKDVADALFKIMVVFGMQPFKAYAAKSVIIEAFTFYDNKRHRPDSAIDETGLTKTCVLFKLEHKCKMTYMEALLVYTVVKRALKAFFHGSADFSIKSPVTEAVAITQQEFIWQHTAARTNQLLVRFEHVFNLAPHNYPQQIIRIYKELYERMRNRADRFLIRDLPPWRCIKKDIYETKPAQKFYTEKFKQKMEGIEMCAQHLPTYDTSLINGRYLSPRQRSKGNRNKTEKTELHLARCYQCNRPQLMSDRKIEPEMSILLVNCSQEGPFKCQWERVDHFEEADFCAKQTEFHICPIDCATSESSTDSQSYKLSDCSKAEECDGMETEECSSN